MTRTTFILAAMIAATGALAHQGVTNPAVKARMQAMSAIAEQMRVLGAMAKGQTAFDSAAARTALAQIESHAGKTPALFAAKETDPKSEARPAIWEDFADFKQKSRELEVTAAQLARSLDGPDDLPGAMAALGGTCKACHGDYRRPK